MDTVWTQCTVLSKVWQQAVLISTLSAPSSFCSACQLLSDLITHILQTLKHLLDLHFIFFVVFQVSDTLISVWLI